MNTPQGNLGLTYGERRMILFVAISAVGLFYAAWVHKPHLPAIKAPPPRLITFTPSTVMGPHPHARGAESRAYTVGEFADYERPFCIDANREVMSLLKGYKGRLCLVFRNYPLTAVHPYAMSAALRAEAAGCLGEFWPMHDALFAANGKLDSKHLSSLTAALKLPQKRFTLALATTAKSIVTRDLRDGKRLGIQGTPTFYLCCPKGEVYLLGSLAQIPKFIR